MDDTPVTSNEQQQAPVPAPVPTSLSSIAPPVSSSSSVPSISSSAAAPSQSQDPNPNSPSISQTQQQSSVQTSQPRPQFNRPWQPPSHYTHFSSSSQLSSIPPFASSSSPSTPPVPPFSSSSSSLSSSSSSSTLPPPVQKGGMAIGLPAHHPTAATSPSSFSSLNPPPLGQQFGGMTRGAAPALDSTSTPSTSQLRPPIQGVQGMGSTGSFSAGQTIRPGGMSSLHHTQRPMQSSVRAQTTANSQASTPQSRSHPWMPSGSQGTPPLPSGSFRPRSITQQLQQRTQVSRQPLQGLPAAASQQQEQVSSSSQQSQPQQQPLSPVNPQQEQHPGPQFPPSRVAQSLTNQLQIPRTTAGIGNQKSPQSVGQTSSLQPTPPVSRAQTADDDEHCNRILSKRSIRELVSQIDPSEKMDPEVEDILVDIADEFMESITTFGCSLAKHRKSTTLEAKDILLHVERNWNMSLPGFGGDEIKTYRKPFTSDIHRERLAAIKKSVGCGEVPTNPKSSTQAIGKSHHHPTRAPLNNLGSPNPPPTTTKTRESA